MSKLLKGTEVSAALMEQLTARAENLKTQGIRPTLAILRVGENDSDIAYERGALKRASQAGVEVRQVILPEDLAEEAFHKTLEELNADPLVHGILMFRPLPSGIDDEKARAALLPSKDVDGCTDGSLAGVFTGTEKGFAPCTAEAVMKILDHYGIDPCGKRAVVIGRSLVIGRPVAMMLMARGATVTICHTKTKNVPEIAREADILIAASGRPESINAAYVREGQVVIDVGVTFSEEKGKLVGDILFDEVEPIVTAITPVPGGVGAVTSTILISHVISAAENKKRSAIGQAARTAIDGN